MTAAELPPALADWSASLAGLSVEVAVALGPMLLRLDELIGRQGGVQGPEGEPDGFDGLTRRGSPEHLLVAEWLLAEEIPDEFRRRAAERELLHLAPARRHDPPHGVVRVLVDTGPAQLGAGRLVQLAALVVLHRRALRIGARLEVGVLGDTPGHWLGGELPELLRAWLSARQRAEPGWDDVRAWTTADPATNSAVLWLFCAPELPATRPDGESLSRRRILTSVESGWDAAGARSVDVRLAAEHLALVLPTGPAAVRALRGEGFRRSDPANRTPGTRSGSVVRHPFFPGAARRLVGRGLDQYEIAWAGVPEHKGPKSRGLRHRRFARAVIGAGLIGARLVVLVAGDDVAEFRFIGQILPRFEGLTVPLSDLDLDADLSAVDLDGPLAPLLYDGGKMLLRIGERWYRIDSSGRVSSEDIVAAVATEAADRPQLAWPGAVPGRPGLIIQPGGFIASVPLEASVRLGHGWTAWSNDDTQWQVVRGMNVHQIPVADGATVLGVVSRNPGPALLTVSVAGLVLRLVGAGGAHTLTGWSGTHSLVPPVVHPTLSLVAVVMADGEVKVADLATERVLLRIGVPE